MLCSACTATGDATRARSSLVAATPDSNVNAAARERSGDGAQTRGVGIAERHHLDLAVRGQGRERGTVKALDDGAAADDRNSDARPRSHRASPARQAIRSR